MIYINGICYIVGASCCGETVSFNADSSDYVIAADGGYDLLKNFNIMPDALIGDFDSVKSSPDHQNILRHPVEKDDTDSFLAYKFGYEKGYRTFVIYGGMGGRIDHTIANMQMLYHMAKNGARGFLIGENTVITAIHNSKFSFPSDTCGNFGVFAQGSDANGVCIKGAKYTADNVSITPEFPIGVSNEFIGEKATVSVSDGTLLLVWYESEKILLEKIKKYMEEF